MIINLCIMVVDFISINHEDNYSLTNKPFGVDLAN